MCTSPQCNSGGLVRHAQRPRPCGHAVTVGVGVVARVFRMPRMEHGDGREREGTGGNGREREGTGESSGGKAPGGVSWYIVQECAYCYVRYYYDNSKYSIK